MPWIQNVSLSSIEEGFHYDAGVNSVLISIVDPDMQYPAPKYSFKETHRFKFLDIEDGDECLDESWRFNAKQAKKIAGILKKALINNSNVIVHCVAGICRSGAVTEVGTILGFQDTEVYRCPNLLVKGLLLKELKYYDYE